MRPLSCDADSERATVSESVGQDASARPRRGLGDVQARFVIGGAVVASILLSGCVARRWDGCAATGAIIGALAAGIAADAADRANNGAVVGGAALGGMALGALIGHTICDPPEHRRESALVPPRVPPPAPPPPPPADVVVTDEQLVTLERIYFNQGEATIQRVSYPVLDGIVKVLNDRPALKIRVEGHTDSKGDARGNERLSLRRAQSVVRYLVSRGIEPERLEAVGFGESRPTAPNETPDGGDNPLGRAKNRRTEFHVRQ